MKIIPVMLLGKVMHGTRYAWGEYVEALLITVGVAIFSVSARYSSFSSYGTSHVGQVIKGVVYMLIYVIFIAFDCQWQHKIYNTYGRRNVDVFQMMLGVSLFSVALTTVSVVWSGETPMVTEFLQANPSAGHSLMLAAAASVMGQVAVFHFIREYGPLIFTIVMTVRQLVSIGLSAIAFSHSIPPLAIVGALVVFGTLAFQIRRNYSLARQPEVLIAT